MKLITKIQILFIGTWIFLNIACSSLEPINFSKEPLYKEYVFAAPYDKIWKAAEKSVSQYTISNNNMDSGIIQTDWARGDNVWTSPDSTSTPSSGMRERITIFLTKGKSQGIPSVKVQVKKELELHKDFLMSMETIKSDGLEEVVILYRIDRELEIERELSKLDRTSSKPHVEPIDDNSKKDDEPN